MSLQTDMAEVKTDVKWLKENAKRHNSHHFQVRLAMIGSLIVSGAAILIAIL